ncbi:YqzE family protein [Alkalicoccobacillus porphyridii]|uniref:YqzE family protein n=1 Tax=Alkalicoccobacillus porphyridii TaxID=2597270 RepID=A0A553ZTC2_9BACI|nr:YqzE family protein [Alkalicoccobacillus porphyridii]TSB44721.1 YqzE family protein [Alkalicoccobacillus porphyridii]
MSFQDLIKFITQQAVIQMDKPGTIRKEERLRRKTNKASFSYRAFGVLPLALSWFIKRNQN